MARVKLLQGGLEALASSAQTHQELRALAEEIAQGVDVPDHLWLTVKAGNGPRGPFSQVIMRGPGALTEEFGSRTRRPNAPLRRRLREMGGR